MTTLHVLRVFIGPDGRGGNPLGVFLDGGAIGPAVRLAVARELGFSETVYVDEVAGGEASIAIYTPGMEMAFAGHPTVGTSWLLRHEGTPVDMIHLPAGAVRTWEDGELDLDPGQAELARRSSDSSIRQPGRGRGAHAGRGGRARRICLGLDRRGCRAVRSRFFASDFGIAEDEATGLAAVVMGGKLGRDLTIRQGVASELYVRPDPAAGTVDVGGRVAPVEVREFGQ